jgi:hypothetical protein
MTSRDPGWRWRHGNSLEVPLPEDEFLRTVGDDVVSVELIAAVREAYGAEVAAAQADVAEADLLEAALDPLSERLFTLAP